MNKASDILSLSLTPVIQRTMHFEEIRVGDVNRARAVAVSVAGKGVNVGRALHLIGAPARVLSFFGGDTGSMALRTLADEGIDVVPVETEGPTRICDTLLDARTGDVTELVEEAPLPSQEEWDAYLSAYENLLRRATMVVLSGALMPGAPEAWYRTLAARAREAGVPLLVDSQKNPLLQAVEEQPLLAKLNRKELAATCGAPVEHEADLLEASRRLCRSGARRVLVTDGPHGAWLVEPDRAWRICPPTIDLVNPIGSGDCVTAGFAAGLSEGMTPVEAAAWGVACGTANALTLLPAHFDAVAARGIVPFVTVTGI
jgi:tagatose 6-phosphate kinase